MNNTTTLTTTITLPKTTQLATYLHMIKIFQQEMCHMVDMEFPYTHPRFLELSTTINAFNETARNLWHSIKLDQYLGF